MFYKKGVVTQSDMYAKPLNICQQFKEIVRLHGHLLTKIIVVKNMESGTYRRDISIS